MENFFCIFNEETSTLRIEKDLTDLLNTDTIIGENDLLSCKVFISYICKQYPQNGNNTTLLNSHQTKCIYNDIEGYMKTFDQIAENNNIIELIENTEWIVK